MNPLLVILIILSFHFQLNVADIYYVDESSTATLQTGSLTNPFPSIAQAYNTLGPISCELLLLGSSASISSVITFASGSNYTIRPDPSSATSGYFLINLQIGANIKVNAANLTLQNLQFKELNPSRSANAYVFQPASGSILTFKSVLIRDVRTTAASYIFCRATSKSIVNIIDSEFRNNTNVGFTLAASTAVVRGCLFTDLIQNSVPFMLLGQYTDGGVGMAFKKNTFRNIVVGNISNSGFIGSIISKTSFILEDFNIKNVTFTAQIPFLFFASSTSTFFDTPGSLTSLTLTNGVIQDILDNYTGPTSTTTSEGIVIYKGLFINCVGQSLLTVKNLTVTNVIIQEWSFILFNPNSDYIKGIWSVAPIVEITNLIVKKSKNVNFVLMNCDNMTISDVYLEDTLIKGANVTYGVFTAMTGNALNVNNLTVNNGYGQLIQSVKVLSQNFSNFFLSNMSNSQNAEIFYQLLIRIEKDFDAKKEGLDLSKSLDTYFENINLNV